MCLKLTPKYFYFQAVQCYKTDSPHKLFWCAKNSWIYFPNLTLYHFFNFLKNEI